MADGPIAAAVLLERWRTVDDAADALRARLVAEGARLSYRQNCESMQRIHISPRVRSSKVDAVETEGGSVHTRASHAMEEASTR